MRAMIHPDEAASSGLRARAREYHEPVLLAEVLAALAPAAGKRIIDGTLGGGGHAAALLAAGAEVIGFDQDPEAIAFATSRLSRFGRLLQPVHRSFAEASPDPR